MKKILFLLAGIIFINAAVYSQVVSIPNAELKKEFVDRHNHWRTQVGVEKLEWSDDLADYAAEWAKQLAKKGCKMEHRPHSGEWKQMYGENLFWGSGEYSPTKVVDMWASEIEYYNGEAISFANFGKFGHYTQVVWYKTTQVGCAKLKCKNSVIWICNYEPRGNTVGEKPYGN